MACQFDFCKLAGDLHTRGGDEDEGIGRGFHFGFIQEAQDFIKKKKLLIIIHIFVFLILNLFYLILEPE